MLRVCAFLDVREERPFDVNPEGPRAVPFSTLVLAARDDACKTAQALQRGVFGRGNCGGKVGSNAMPRQKGA